MAITQPHVWEDLVYAAVMAIVMRRGEEQSISPEEIKRMQFKCDIERALHRFAIVARLQWQDPDPPFTKRGVQIMADERTALRDERLQEAIAGDFVNNLDIRGELFFFKLHKHFPKHLRDVKCVRPGELIVTFKNGRSLDAKEDALESREFLATCAMIFDL